MAFSASAGSATTVARAAMDSPVMSITWAGSSSTASDTRSSRAKFDAFWLSRPHKKCRNSHGAVLVQERKNFPSEQIIHRSPSASAEFGGVEGIDRASYCCGTDLLVPCINACISSWVSRPSLLLSIALKIRS